MEHAALAIRDVVMELLATQLCQLVIIAGKGNNGGDALAAARLLSSYQPDILLTNATPTSPLAMAQLHAVRTLGLQPELYEPSTWLQRKYHGKRLLIIDGIVGLGLTGKLTSPLQALVAEIRAYPNKQVIAIDIPSALRCDDADADGDTITADITITFGGKKPAHVLPPAQDHCGEVRVAEIFPASCVATVFADQPSPLHICPQPSSNAKPDAFAALPASAHKYQRGHVLVIGGSAGKLGAPLLSALAALRTGAGWVSVALPMTTASSHPSCLPLDLTYENFFENGAINIPALTEFVAQRQVRAIVVGCGCVKSPLNAELWQYLLQFARQHPNGAVILDAGALDGLSTLWEAGGAENIILTPHAGEWQRLATPKLPQPDSVENIVAIKNIAVKRGLTLVYKNSSPLVFSPHPHEPVYVCEGGDNSLAKAGTGDIYAGIVAALALGMSGEQAAVSAYYHLRRAAHRLSKQAFTHQARVGLHGITASLLIDAL